MKKLYLAILLFASIVTTYANTITSTAKGGTWNEADTWEGNLIPQPQDQVVIAQGAVVTITKATVCAGIQVSGTLNFSAGTLVVNGDMVVNEGGYYKPWAGGSISFAVNGNFVNNGTVDLSRNGSVIRMGAPVIGAPTAISGTGKFIKGVVRTLRIDNPNGVKLNIPLSVSANLGLWSGVFTIGTNLTLDNTNPGNGKRNPFIKLEKKKGTLAGNYQLGATATLNED